jgi:hypothetical protein
MHYENEKNTTLPHTLEYRSGKISKVGTLFSHVERVFIGVGQDW